MPFVIIGIVLCIMSVILKRLTKNLVNSTGNHQLRTHLNLLSLFLAAGSIIAMGVGAVLVFLFPAMPLPTARILLWATGILSTFLLGFEMLI